MAVTAFSGCSNEEGTERNISIKKKKGEEVIFKTMILLYSSHSQQAVNSLGCFMTLTFSWGRRRL